MTVFDICVSKLRRAGRKGPHTVAATSPKIHHQGYNDNDHEQGFKSLTNKFQLEQRCSQML